ncbi:MAG: hypothetical protein POH28_15145 [Acidocella sp.]|nr:hypothetical protein [Acidocella sp.]
MQNSLQTAERKGTFEPKNTNTGVINSITARLVVNENTHLEAQRLRYEAYRAAGYLAEHDGKLFSDVYDTKPTSQSVLLYQGDEPVASVRICQLDQTTDTKLGLGELPASAMFKTEIETFLEDRSKRGGGTRAVEITRLARSPRYAKNNTLILGLYHIAGYLILHFKADVIFVAVTTNHASFYRRMGFRQIAPPKDYPGLAVQTVLMGCLIHEHRRIPGRILALADVTLPDDTYRALFAGETVPVFAGLATAAADSVHDSTQAENVG